MAGPTNPIDKRKLEKEMGFSYCTAIGRLIYAMVTCRPDISFAVTKLSQYANQPAPCHFTAVKNVFRYLAATKDEGLAYWRKTPNETLPDGPEPIPITPSHKWTVNLEGSVHISPLHGFVDSNWASDTTHRRSVTGIVYMMAGAAVVYKTKFQKTVALSSTEAEFVAAADAGKYALYLRSLLKDLGEDQELAVVLYEDNVGAYLMADAGQPTTRTRHIDIKHFALLDWVENDMIKLQRIATSINSADNLTKSTPRIIFHRHNDIIMGKFNPKQFVNVRTCFAYRVQ